MATTEIDALKAIDDALSKLSKEERNRVLAWANNKYSSRNAGYENPAGTKSHLKNSTNPPESKTKSKRSKSSSSSKSASLKQLKELKFNGNGKKSFAEFIEEKKPTNQKQKCTVAIYYLSNIMEIDAVTPNHVYTAFKAAKWPVPADIMNTMHQAGSEGWLDTEDASSIKVTHIGDNLIEHELPKKTK